jgi:ribosomal protein L7Ae-like RNA K-turn-binding protein
MVRVQIITPELNNVVDQLLRTLRTFQERAIAKDPIKGKMRKRLMAGLREVGKAVKLKKAHSVVVVPNIESVSAEGECLLQ